MKKFTDILPTSNILNSRGNLDVHVRNITADSREVNQGDVFVAIDGTAIDGHKFIPEVLKKQPSVVVCQNDDWIGNTGEIPVVVVSDSRMAIAEMASRLYDQPSRKLEVVGVTGTNGKTSIATMLYRMFELAGKKSGLISTIDIRSGTEVIESTHTTPDPVRLQQILAEMVQAGCTHCFMEVSSHAIDQKRIAGVHFKGGIFTNISHDHLDYHKTFDEYLRVKKQFFDGLSADAFALVNADDKRSSVMVQNTKAKKYTYALKQAADYKGRVKEADFSGTLMSLNDNEVYATTVGDFNASNLMAAYATADLLQLEEEVLLKALSRIGNIPGRFQVIRADGFTGIIDYAHSPDALEKVLLAIRDLNRERGRVITVTGCGGDRDTQKRPEMAKIAVNYSSKVILTSDNPRNEDPNSIIEDMKKGIPDSKIEKVFSVPDRKEAIRMACSLAGAGDIVLVAGKGHEKYQITGDKKLPFDDLEILEQQLKQKI